MAILFTQTCQKMAIRGSQVLILRGSPLDLLGVSSAEQAVFGWLFSKTLFCLGRPMLKQNVNGPLARPLDR